MKYLSRVGRITLAQLVISSIPVFNMKLEKFPSRVHKELNTAVQKCVLSKRGGSRGIHLVNWDLMI